MAILGGAMLPEGMGLISDPTFIHYALVVVLVSYCVVLYFAI